MTDFPIPQFFTNKMFAEIFQQLSYAVKDTEGKCDFVLTEAGVEFFYEHAALKPKELMLILGDELEALRKRQFENNTYGMAATKLPDVPASREWPKKKERSVTSVWKSEKWK